NSLECNSEEVEEKKTPAQGLGSHTAQASTPNRCVQQTQARSEPLRRQGWKPLRPPCVVGYFTYMWQIGSSAREINSLTFLFNQLLVGPGAVKTSQSQRNLSKVLT
ncbi:unnamed protein product, partial [Arctogadus glacialis]